MPWSISVTVITLATSHVDMEVISFSQCLISDYLHFDAQLQFAFHHASSLLSLHSIQLERNRDRITYYTQCCLHCHSLLFEFKGDVYFWLLFPWSYREHIRPTGNDLFLRCIWSLIETFNMKYYHNIFHFKCKCYSNFLYQ